MLQEKNRFFLAYKFEQHEGPGIRWGVATLEKIHQIKSYLHRKQTGPVGCRFQYNEEYIQTVEEGIVDEDVIKINLEMETTVEELIQNEDEQGRDINLNDLEMFFQQTFNDLSTENPNFDALRAMYNLKHPVFQNGPSDPTITQPQIPTLEDFQNEE
jgi:hypothetical protein